MIHRILYRLLSQSANIANKVGVRIYQDRAPQKTTGDYIVITRVSASPEYHLTAESDCAVDIIQLAYVSTSRAAAEAGFNLIRNRISGYRGDVTYLADDGTYATGNISECTCVRGALTVEMAGDASDKYRFLCSSDYQIFSSQSVPTLT